MRHLIAAVGAACACAVALALTPSPAAPASATCPVETYAYKRGIVSFNEHGDVTRVQVEIADNELKQAYGLMCRTSLAPNAGMLFWFSQPSEDQFWMKNTLIPLSIAFLDAHWHIVTLVDMPVAPDPENGPFSLYSSKAPYLYALEVNQGFFAQHGIDTSAVVTFQPLESVGH